MKKLVVLLAVILQTISYGQTAIEFFQSGNAKSDLQDYAGAILDYNKAISLNPKDSMSYNNRGYANFKLKQKESACLDFSKAGELGYSEAYENIVIKTN